MYPLVFIESRNISVLQPIFAAAEQLIKLQDFGTMSTRRHTHEITPDPSARTTNVHSLNK